MRIGGYNTNTYYPVFKQQNQSGEGFTTGAAAGKKPPMGPEGANHKGGAMQGRPPMGPGGNNPMEGRKPDGPNLDLNSDGNWSKDELDKYTTYSSNVLGISLNTDELISKYDSDKDGQINASERDVLASENGLKLPSPSQGMPESQNGNSMYQNNSNGSNQNNYWYSKFKYINTYLSNMNYSAITQSAINTTT